MQKPRAKKLSKIIHAAACSLAFGSVLMSATAQAQSDGIASIFLGQENGYNSDNNTFTNTIDLVTDDQSLTIGAAVGYDYVQKVTTTTILFGPGDWAGLSNILDASIWGNDNAVYFTQLGNSLLSMVIDGERNTVTLAELGGSDEWAENANLKIWGDGNELSTFKTTGGIAKTLDIELGSSIADSNYNIVELSYDDFSEITGKIGNLADTANVTVDIRQNYYTTPDPSASRDINNNSVDFVINNILMGGNDSSVFFITQDGLNNVLQLSAEGDGYDVNIYQENVGTFLNRLDLTLGSDTTLDLDLFGSNDSTIELLGKGNTVRLDNSTTPYATAESEILIGDYADPSGSDRNYVNLSDFGYAYVEITGSDNRIGADNAPTVGNVELSLEGDFNAVDIFNDRVVTDLENPYGVTLEITGDSNKVWIEESGDYSDYNEYYITGNDNSLFVDISGFSGTTLDWMEVTIDGDSNSLGAMIDLVGAANFGDPVIALTGNFNKVGMDNNNTYSSAPSSTASFADLVGSAEANSKFAYDRIGPVESFITLDYLNIDVDGDGNMMQFSNGALTEGVATAYTGIFNIDYYGDNNAFTYNLWGAGDFTHDVGNRDGSVYSSNWNGVIASNGSGGFNMNITQLGSGESILSSQGGQVIVTNSVP